MKKVETTFRPKRKPQWALELKVTAPYCNGETFQPSDMAKVMTALNSHLMSFRFKTLNGWDFVKHRIIERLEDEITIYSVERNPVITFKIVDA